MKRGFMLHVWRGLGRSVVYVLWYGSVFFLFFFSISFFSFIVLEVSLLCVVCVKGWITACVEWYGMWLFVFVVGVSGITSSCLCWSVVNAVLECVFICD